MVKMAVAELASEGALVDHYAHGAGWRSSVGLDRPHHAGPVQGGLLRGHLGPAVECQASVGKIIREPVIDQSSMSRVASS
jgi:hypothetical protein